MRVVYVAHPIRGDVEGNKEKARSWVLFITRQGYAAQAPYLIYLDVLDDDDLEDRKLGMTADMAILAKCDEVWLCGPTISDGMEAEADFARECGIPVIHLTDEPWHE